MKTMLSAMGAVLLGLTCVGAPYAAEQRPDEMVVAMGYLGAIRTIPRPTAPVATPSPAVKPTPSPVPSAPAVASPPSDTTAPTAALSAPMAGATVSGTAVAVGADAADNIGVSRVEFYIDGALKVTDTTTPYSFSWDTTNGGVHACNGPHTHTLVARAYDTAGNSRTSGNVVVNMNDPSYCAKEPKPVTTLPAPVTVTPTPTPPSTVPTTLPPALSAPAAATSTYTLVVSQTMVNAGASVTATWNAPAGSSAKDWVGLYKVGANNRSFVGSQWVYTGGLTSGTFTTTMPATAGTYEFRFLQNDDYTDIARSRVITVTAPVTAPETAPAASPIPTPPITTPTPPAVPTSTYNLSVPVTSVTAGANVTVTWSAPSGSSLKDWVGLFKVGDSNSSFGKWVYTGGLLSGTFTTTTPATPGTYEFRFLQNDGFTDVARSQAITVTSTTASTSTPPATSTPTAPATPAPSSPSNGSGVTYYVATDGDDNNPGTLAQPFKTVTKAIPLLKPGYTLLVRGGEYDTAAGGLSNGLAHGGFSIIPSGTSWANPVTIKAYNGENVVFRRYLPPGRPYTEQQFRDSIHFATYAEAAAQQAADPTHTPSYTSAYPYSAWSGCCLPDGLDLQSKYGPVTMLAPSKVLDMLEINNTVQYVIFDGINLDAKGIALNPLGINEAILSQGTASMHLLFKNLEIRYGIKSCMSSWTDDGKVDLDIEFNNVKIHSCGAPYDTSITDGVLSRMHPVARFYHGWYSHSGGLRFINGESYNHAGTGMSTVVKNNVISGSYIHDNAQYGLMIDGTDNVATNNVFYNNGGIEVLHRSGSRQTISNNTIVAGPRYVSGKVGYSWGLSLSTLAYDSVYENNLIEGFKYGIYNTSPSGNSANVGKLTVRNNFIRTSTPGYEIFTHSDGGVAPVTSGNIINQDPKLMNLAAGDYRLQSNSPAINSGFANSLTSDHAGCARNDGKMDIGAYEHNTNCTPAPLQAAVQTPVPTPTPTATPTAASTSPVTVFAPTPASTPTPSPISYCTSNCVGTPPDTVVYELSVASVTYWNDINFEYYGTGCRGGACSLFQCSLDNGPFVSCSTFSRTSPVNSIDRDFYIYQYSPLSLGLHTVSVRAIDSVAGPDLSPHTFSWTVTPDYFPGSCVEILTSVLNIRDEANGWTIGTQQSIGAQGVIRKGLTRVAESGDRWIKVDYYRGGNVDAAMDGWHTVRPVPVGTSPANIKSIACVSPVPAAPAEAFVIGHRIQVNGGAQNVNVRDRALISGNSLGFHSAGDLGTIVEGPITSTGYTWWKVRYDSGAGSTQDGNGGGWSAQEFISTTTGSSTPIATPTVTPTPTPTPAVKPPPTPAPAPTPAPVGTYNLSVSQASVNGGANVSVSWTAPAGSTAKDWIGLFKVGDPNNNFTAGKWTHTNGAAAGSYTTTAPATGGTYEFRYLLNDGYTEVTRSTAITVAGTTPAATPAPPSQPTATPPLSGANVYYVSSGVNSGGLPAGNDSHPGTQAQPWQTLRGALKNMIAHYGYSAPGVTLIVRTGEYDTVNGLATDNFTDTLFPSGSGSGTSGSGNSGTWAGSNTFKIVAYPGHCDVNACEDVTFVRGLNPGATHTIAQMQSASCNGHDCVGAPTQEECAYIGAGSGYPSNCWYGGGTPSGPGLPMPLDRSGDLVRSGGVLNMSYFTNFDTNHLIRYVEFDGIDFDARGIAQNVLSVTSRNDKTLIGKFVRFKNGEWRNSAGSCWANPGSDDTDANGLENTGDFEFYNFKIHHCGMPYNTYVVPGTGVNARLHPDAKYLHGWYGHHGNNLCDNCEAYQNSGQGLAPEGKGNIIRNSYIHDNACIGLQSNGPSWILENTIFYNNGCMEIQLRNFTNSRYSNNTFVAGPRNSDLGIQIHGFSHAGILENNIIEGFARAIENFACGGTGSTCFYASEPNIIRNNLIRSTRGPSYEIRDATTPVVTPTKSGNISNQDPKLVNPAAGDFRLQGSSPAINAGAKNGLTSDKSGKPRTDGVIDIGAYEYGN